jgi:hypothetical protein
MLFFNVNTRKKKPVGTFKKNFTMETLLQEISANELNVSEFQDAEVIKQVSQINIELKQLWEELGEFTTGVGPNTVLADSQEQDYEIRKTIEYIRPILQPLADKTTQLKTRVSDMADDGRLANAIPQIKRSTRRLAIDVQVKRESIDGELESVANYAKKAKLEAQNVAEQIAETKKNMKKSSKSVNASIEEFESNVAPRLELAIANASYRNRATLEYFKMWLTSIKSSAQRAAVDSETWVVREEKVQKDLEAYAFEVTKITDAILTLNANITQNLETVSAIVRGDDVTAGQTKDACVQNETGKLSMVDHPCKTIWELNPPPYVNLGLLKTVKQTQDFVASEYGIFTWNESDSRTDKFDCAPVGTMGFANKAQSFASTYMIPNNSTINLLLNHSTGAGKTVTLMQIASVFMRMGYVVLFVTSKALKAGGDYFKTAFERGADFNIMQYLAYKGARTLPELIAREKKIPVSQVTTSEVNARGIKIWQEMGGIFHKEEQLLSYWQYSNMMKNIIAGKRDMRVEKILQWTKSKHTDPQSPKYDPLRRTIAIIDEIQQLTQARAGTEDRTLAPGAIAEAYWRSRERSKRLAGRIVGASATPGNDHASDVALILNMQVQRKAGFNLIRPDELSENWMTLRPKILPRFDKQYVDPRTGNINPTGRSQFIRCIRGQVSYLNLLGDQSHFAIKWMKHINVFMSKTQDRTVAGCIEEFAHLRFDPKKKQWTQRASGKSNAASMQELVRKHNTVERKRPKQQRWDQINVKTALDTLVNIPMLNQCLEHATVWPTLSKQGSGTPREISTFQGMDNLTAAEMMRRNPLFGALEMKISADKVQSNIDLLEYRASDNYEESKDNNGTLPRFIKQMIFMDTENSVKKEAFGVRMVAKFLEKSTLGFVSVTDERTGELKSEGELAEIPDYQGMLVLSAATERTYRGLVDLFNSDANKDGRIIFLVIVSGRYKVGLNLAGIGYVHVIAYLKSLTGMKQGVARAIRNCMSTDLPWKDGNATITVNVYVQKFSQLGKYKNSTPEIKDVVSEVVARGKRLQTKPADYAEVPADYANANTSSATDAVTVALDDVLEMLRVNAVDADLFKFINDKSSYENRKYSRGGWGPSTYKLAL